MKGLSNNVTLLMLVIDNREYLWFVLVSVRFQFLRILIAGNNKRWCICSFET